VALFVGLFDLARACPSSTAVDRSRPPRRWVDDRRASRPELDGQLLGAGASKGSREVFERRVADGVEAVELAAAREGRVARFGVQPVVAQQQRGRR
jgi:hypothetical protein